MNVVDVFVSQKKGPHYYRIQTKKWYGHLKIRRITRRHITHPYFLFASIKEP
jgi:endoglucanase Acf2